MSEEILKALMELFAIVSKQDTGANDSHRTFVESFLKNQLSNNTVLEYLALYDNFLKDKESRKKEETAPDQESGKKPRLTSVLDSVKTLAICKKINKTLVQKQKTIVLIRLLELLKARNEFTPQRLSIIDTASNVFNIPDTELKLIQHFVVSEQPDPANMPDLLLIDQNHQSSTASGNHIHSAGLDGLISIIRIQSSNLIFLRYTGSSDLFLNGLPIHKQTIYLVAPGSTIRLPRGTIYYNEILNTLSHKTDFTKLKYSVTNLDFTFPNGKKALNNITLEEKSGTLVAIMGASGAGKTTLLNTLCGIEKQSAGTIKINDFDLSSEPEVADGLIGYISQDDLLFEDLTVFENLYYNAELCFKNTDKPRLHKLVLQTLNNLGLLEIKDIVVGNALNKKISGGQRKRLNIALELIREPAILFVDEPTSGLSSRDSENVMDLLKELTQKGKLIFIVIHQPSSDIFKMFDKLILLDVGGHQIYYGNPIEGVMYFKKITNQLNADIGECDACGNVNPELIFNLIESKEIDEYGVFTNKRKFSPADWSELYQKKQSVSVSPDDLTKYEKPARNNNIPGKLRQLVVFLKRDLFSKLANKQYILINLLEVPALAAFLALLIRYINRKETGSTYSYFYNDNIPAYFFITILIALLIGLTVSAEEIYKDQKNLKREKNLKLSKASYLFSKVIILFSLSSIQSFLLCIVGNTILGIPGNFLNLYVVIFSVFCSANIMGLILSATFNSPVTIYIIIPFIIIPQMLLGGAMLRYSKLNSVLGGDNKNAPPLANLIVSRWAYEALIVNEFKNNRYEQRLFSYDKLESNLSYKLSYLFPKLDELVQTYSDTQDSMAGNRKKFTGEMIDNNITDEYRNYERLFGKIERNDEEDSLTSLKNAVNLKYNFIISKKDSLIGSLQKKGIRKEDYCNRSIQEIVTNALEIDKILVDSATHSFIQIVDPVFQDAKKNVWQGLKSPMYSSSKTVLGLTVSTFWYNIVIIWIINILGFLMLYSDLLKKLLNLKLRPFLSKNPNN